MPVQEFFVTLYIQQLMFKQTIVIFYFASIITKQF